MSGLDLAAAISARAERPDCYQQEEAGPAVCSRACAHCNRMCDACVKYAALQEIVQRLIRKSED